MDPNKIYNVTHSSDLDGMASAALIVKNYGVPLENVYFTNYSDDILKNSLKSIGKIKGSGNLLVISDFGINQSTYGMIRKALSAFKKKGNRIMWFDHHLWTDDQIKGMGAICDVLVVTENKDANVGDTGNCGAELVYKFLCKKDKFSDELTRITHLSDFNPIFIKTMEDKAIIDRVGHAIKHLSSGDDSSSKKLRKLVGVIAKNGIYNSYITTAAKAYEKESKAELKKIIDTAHVLNAKGKTIVVGFGKKVQHQQACMTLLDNFGADMVVYCSVMKGHSSVRSLIGFDSSKLSLSLGGGGHPLASGFAVDKRRFNYTTEKGKKKFVNYIKEFAEKKF